MSSDPASDQLLRGVWYMAMPASQLRRGRMQAQAILGEPILFARHADGAVFALRNICPHRAMPLHYGRFDGQEVECPYHGWKFDRAGACTHIPSLTGGEGVACEKIQVRHYPVREQQGLLWVWLGHSAQQPPDEEPPHIPALALTAQPRLYEQVAFPCHIDHAVVGLMDPAHGPFVHQSWWWRGRHSIHAKAKHFAPAHRGFVMERHRPSSNSLAYKLLGGQPETEIRFQLPGVRIEQVQVGQNWLCNLTAVTPRTASSTIVHHAIYWTQSWLDVVRPLARPFVRRFLAQDRDTVVQQQEGLQHERNLLLIRDADTQARWYYQLKREFERAHAEGRDFQNPVTATVLRWRS